MHIKQTSLTALPILFCTILAITKSIYIGNFLGGSHDSEIYVYLLRNDLPFLGFVGFFCFAASVVSQSWLKSFCLSFTGLALCWYLLDIGAIFTLNARAPISELVHYAVEWRVYSDLALWALVLILITLFIIHSSIFRLEIRSGVAGLFLCGALMLLPTEITFNSMGLYSTPIFTNRDGRNLFAKESPLFSENELLQAHADIPIYHDMIPDTQRRNIAMIIIESWSAVDSYKTSKIRDLTPKLDQIANEGMLFTRFIANGENTEEGLISLLSGTPPLQYPGHSWSHYKSFAYGDSAVTGFTKQGYRTEFISSATLKFRNKQFFLDSLKFESLFGMENVREFQDSEHFAFGAATDQVLYKRALNDIIGLSNKGQPYIIFIETTSSHLPYLDPENRDNSEESIWRYVDNQAYLFFNELNKTNFFDNGILIITSDHHKMLPVTEAEIKLFGHRASAAIPLIIIGKGIPKSIINDRQLQQSDLLLKLAEISNQNTALTNIAFHANSYHKPLLFGDNPAKITTFIGDSSDKYDVFTFGTQVSWTNPVPNVALRTDAENQLRRIFARRQYCTQAICD